MPRKFAPLLLLLILVGCNAAPTPTSVHSAPLLFTPKPTNTIQLPTATPRPSASSTPSPTAAQVPTITPTPVPTLTTDEMQELVRKMLKDNGGCDLPCWWGIMPEKTDWQTLKDRFIMYDGTVFDIPHVGQFFDYRVTHSFVQSNKVVQSIHVTAEVFRGTQSKQFAQDWKRYSLDQMLTRYGRPSQVQIELANLCLESGCGPAPYNLFVFYDHLGILVRYQGPAIRGDPIRACPAFGQLEYLELWLQSPEQKDSLLQTANLDSSELSHMRPLTETTGISLEQFYETFKNPQAQACLKSPAKYWQ